MMIRDLITEVLSENNHTTTAGTITALVNIKRQHRKLIPAAVGDVRRALNAMVRRGDLVEDVDAQRIVRYRLRPLCYALCAPEGQGWRVVRLHAAGETIIADNMTEAEARCCVTALKRVRAQGRCDQGALVASHASCALVSEDVACQRTP